MNISKMSNRELEEEFYRMENCIPEERMKEGSANKFVYDMLCKALKKRNKIREDVDTNDKK